MCTYRREETIRYASELCRSCHKDMGTIPESYMTTDYRGRTPKVVSMKGSLSGDRVRQVGPGRLRCLCSREGSSLGGEDKDDKNEEVS